MGINTVVGIAVIKSMIKQGDRMEDIIDVCNKNQIPIDKIDVIKNNIDKDSSDICEIIFD